MGVLNVTPDSFSDGGRWFQNGRPSLDALRREAAAMVAAGADFVDVGGESTRPGASPVSEQEELDRVIPVIEALAGEVGAVISLDSSNPAVMRAAAAAGAGMLNDVRALGRDGAVATAVELGLPVCLMHMQGTPDTMQNAPSYANVVAEVRSFLVERAQACIAAGVRREQIVLDPGFGFGKTVDQNLELLSGLPRLSDAGYPLLVGLSRKSMIARLTGRDVADRLPGSLALALLAVERGAAIVRVHDVPATADVLAIFRAVQNVELQ